MICNNSFSMTLYSAYFYKSLLYSAQKKHYETRFISFYHSKITKNALPKTKDRADTLSQFDSVHFILFLLYKPLIDSALISVHPVLPVSEEWTVLHLFW